MSRLSLTTGTVANDGTGASLRTNMQSADANFAELYRGTPLAWFNVKDPSFAGGAFGDGSHDDTAAIQAGLDAATNNGVCWIPPGLYQFSNLKIPFGAQMRGAGWRNTTLRAISGTTGIALTDKVTVAGEGSTGIWISDLEIRGTNQVGLDGIKLGYGGLGGDQFNFLGGMSRCVIRFFNGNGVNLFCNVAELRDCYIMNCDINLVTTGAVLRAYGLALQQSTGGRELQHAAKDSIFHHLHVETNAGVGQISLNVAAGGNRTYFDGLTFSGGPGLVTNTILNFAATVKDCRVRHLAINLDQPGSDYTNAIFDANRTPSFVFKTDLADPLLLAAYSQDASEFPQTPTEATVVSGIDARDGNVNVTLTAARVVGAPTFFGLGRRITFTFLQDGTGGWAVTWNAVFKVSFSNVGNVANTRSSVEFEYNGTNWNQVSAQAPWI